MKTTPIKSIAHLKEVLSAPNIDTLDFAIILNHGAYSRKEIFYHNPEKWEDETPAEYDAKYLNKFEILNCIDGTTQVLTEKELEDESITHIGEAIKLNAFVQLNYDD